MIRWALMVGVLLFASAGMAAAQQTGEYGKGKAEKKPPKPVKSQEELEKDFSEMMTGATLVGNFTLTGRPSTELKDDRYTLGEVKKIKDDLWSFESRIQYGDKDVKVKLRIPIKWAGDTPMIYMNESLVPGMGEFTCRVLFYEGQYAGTWNAGDHGGPMFGRVERADPNKPADAKPADAAKANGDKSAEKEKAAAGK